MTNDKDSAVTQADIDAAKLYLQGTGPWALDEIGIGPDDSLAIAFARHRIASSQPTQSDALAIAREALEGMVNYSGMRESWQDDNPQYVEAARDAIDVIDAALEQSK